MCNLKLNKIKEDRTIKLTYGFIEQLRQEINICEVSKFFVMVSLGYFQKVECQ